MLGARSTTVARTLFAAQRRNAGGFLHKNIRVEENAGLRESSYKYWKLLDGGNILKLTLGLFIPGYFFYSMTIAELAKRDVQVGNDRKYGIVFDVDVNDLGKRRPA